MNKLVAVCIIGFAFALTGASCDKTTQKVKPTPTDTSTNNGQKTDPPESAPTFEKRTPIDAGPKAPALYMMSGLKGYTEPCGCTLDIMLGGIDRIVAFMDDTKSMHTHRLNIHAGDMLFEGAIEKENEPQERARVDLVVEGLKRIGFAVTTPGPHDFELGAEYFAQKMKEANIEVLATNIAGVPGTKSDVTLKLGDQDVWITAIADPEKFKSAKLVSVSAPKVSADAAPENAVRVLLAVGDVEFARKHAEGFDFVQVAGKVRETDQSDPAGSAFTVEPYDQGRYMGILKLYGLNKSGPFTNARSGSKTEVDKLDRQIERIRTSIKKLPPATPGHESELLLNLRKRLDDTRRKRDEIKNAKVEPSETQRSFLWRPVPLEPGYREDDTIKAARESYNKSLKVLSQKVERTIPPVEEGKPYYVGSQECAMCHVEETEYWKETAHGRAWETLEKRDKDFDHKCVGCHSVGYELPGGSVIGKFQYDHDLVLQKDLPPQKITKDLRNVGCENCHGPGSMHRIQPLDADGKPQHIVLDGGEETCGGCHVPEHSPKFNYPVYRNVIVGPGHMK